MSADDLGTQGAKSSAGMVLIHWVIALNFMWKYQIKTWHIDGVVQDCNISSALVMEILQFCSKPLISV